MGFNYYYIFALIVIISLFIDAYILAYLNRQRKNKKVSSFRYRWMSTYLLTGIAITLFCLTYPFIIGLPLLSGTRMRWYFTMFGLLFLFQVPKLLYQLFHLLDLPFKRLLKIKFLSSIGLALSVILFIGTVYGMIWGKTNFKVKKINLQFSRLPAAFDGFSIIQISDIHLGSFYDKHKMQEAADIISSQNPDIVVFTGDLINVTAFEALDYINIFRKITASAGKFSVLGNHDMNDYRKIDRARGGISNIKNVITLNKAMGFDILLNEHRYLVRKNDTIALLGILNWGKPPFKQYGRISEALDGLRKEEFKILLSHDPSFWNAEVLPNTDIDLTLSGHTHGFQFGINCRRFQWSPFNRLYSQWLGLYEINRRYLYVNAGLGFVGLPARVGISPEITVITLRRSVTSYQLPVTSNQ